MVIDVKTRYPCVLLNKLHAVRQPVETEEQRQGHDKTDDRTGQRQCTHRPWPFIAANQQHQYADQYRAPDGEAEQGKVGHHQMVLSNSFIRQTATAGNKT